MKRKIKNSLPDLLGPNLPRRGPLSVSLLSPTSPRRSPRSPVVLADRPGPRRSSFSRVPPSVTDRRGPLAGHLIVVPLWIAGPRCQVVFPNGLRGLRSR